MMESPRPKYTRAELEQALRKERTAVVQRLSALKRELRSINDQIEELEARLRDIEQAEGLL